jgi:peptide deformylase
MVNPFITASTGETVHEEGCLSFPGAYAKVKRFEKITVEYFDLEGQPQTVDADSWLSICIQHELDHLNGITFFDHLSTLKQKLIRSKLDKQRDKIL